MAAAEPGRGRKRAAFGLILWIAAAIAIELGALAVLWLAPRWGWPTRAEIRSALAHSESDAPVAERRSASNVLHPYTGFVRNPQAGRSRRVNRLRVADTVNEFGFFGDSPLLARAPDAFRIALTGGSVAEELFLYARDTLAAEVAASGAVGDRPVEIVSVALAGFKQPQQLFAISYLLVLGARFDVVVNLDGFNEVVLPFTDNVPGGLAPSFPFRWNSVAADGIDPEAATLIAALAELDASQRGWRRAVDRFPLRHSAAALFVWQLAQRRAEMQRAALEIALRERLGAALPTGPQLRGPPGPAAVGSLFADSVSLWRRASLALKGVCDSHGVAYVHFLQPNQYVTDSKPLAAAERRTALLPAASPTRLGAEQGYPLLIDSGRELADAGFPFVDLTALFHGETEPVYRDACCHYFELGYETIAKRIAREIVARVAPLQQN